MEEKLPEQNPVQENPQEQSIPQEQHIPKSEQIQQKKAQFLKRLKLIGIIIAGLILLFIILGILKGIYLKTKQNYIKEDVPPVDVVVKTPDEQEELNKKENYHSEKYGFSFDYKGEDTLSIIDTENREFSASVISSDVIPTENPSGDNLVKGFIFTVNPLNLAGRDLSDVATVKQEWFRENCPNTATFTDIYYTNIASHDGKQFQISKCNSEYIISYIPANNYIYEIIQIYKGDVGFIQKYKLETELIKESFTLYEDLPEPDPFINYFDRRTGVAFKYPRELDSSCCNTPSIPVKGNDRVYHLITISPGGDEKAIGFYLASYGDKSTYEMFATKLEDLLRDDYKVVKGREAPGSRKEITVGKGIKAYLYEDLSWKGNDIILVENQNSNNDFFTITYMEPDESLLNSILSSVTYTR